MSTKNQGPIDAQPGDTIKTSGGEATVLAVADSKEELVERLEHLIEEGR